LNSWIRREIARACFAPGSSSKPLRKARASGRLRNAAKSPSGAHGSGRESGSGGQYGDLMQMRKNIAAQQDRRLRRIAPNVRGACSFHYFQGREFREIDHLVKRLKLHGP